MATPVVNAKNGLPPAGANYWRRVVKPILRKLKVNAQVRDAAPAIAIAAETPQTAPACRIATGPAGRNARTASCQLPHVALVLSGALHVVMDDGSEEDFRKNDVMLLPPGHDAWTIGDESCVFVEFSRGNDYYGTH